MSDNSNPLVLAYRGALRAHPLCYDSGGWDEAKHPRGQPGNAGQFGPGGGEATAGKTEGVRSKRTPGKAKTKDRPKEVVAGARYVDVARKRRVIKAVRNEGELAEAIDGYNLPDSEPADVVYLEDAAGKRVTTREGVRDQLRRRELAVKTLKSKTASDEQREAAERVLSTVGEFFEVKTLLTSKSGKARMSRKAMKRKERWMDRYAIAFSVVLCDDRRGKKYSGHRVYVAAGTLGGTIDPAHMHQAADLAAVLPHVRGD